MTAVWITVGWVAVGPVFAAALLLACWLRGWHRP